MTIKANYTDLPQIMAVLKKNDLPFEDINVHIDNFLKIEKQDEIIGVVGLEVYKNFGLLRSLSIAEDFKNQGLGKQLVTAIETYAKEKSLTTLFLLTTTAEGFFRKINYIEYDRNMVPQQISQTKEFKKLCPLSAICMHKKLEVPLNSLRES